MRIEEFDYLLPKEMIAQYPAEERTSSRLLVLDRGKNTIEHKHFQDITNYLRKGDLLVLNDSKVFPARLTGRKETGGAVDILLVEKTAPDKWLCLIRNAKKGIDKLDVSIGDQRAVLTKEGPSWTIRFLYDGDSDDCGERAHLHGLPHLPPSLPALSNMNWPINFSSTTADCVLAIVAPSASMTASPPASRPM